MSELLVNPASQREPLQASYSDAQNPIGIDGIEYIEYTTAQPQALGQILEMVGFRPIARHRSREVMLYRQGELNVVINAHPDDVTATLRGHAAPVISAIALRVRDASSAYQHAIEKGAWPVPAHAEVMELNIPAIHGVGESRIYFVDRYQDFSIYDVDFIPIPSVDQRPAATLGMHFFGVVQYIGPGRSYDWIAFYQELLGFDLIPDSERFGIMPKGKLLRSPAIRTANQFMWQLVEPHVDAPESSEKLHRIGLGVPNVFAAVQALRERGIEFVETEAAHTESRGAITKTYLGAVVFELVQSNHS